jgi:hypothetical protein
MGGHGEWVERSTGPDTDLTDELNATACERRVEEHKRVS